MCVDRLLFMLCDYYVTIDKRKKKKNPCIHYLIVICQITDGISTQAYLRAGSTSVSDVTCRLWNWDINYFALETIALQRMQLIISYHTADT